MPDPVLPSAFARPQQPAKQEREALHMALTELESMFLSEMLESAGLGQTSESFGGGVGEEQFASFLRQEQAGQMARAGGIGLAEAMFASLAHGASDE